MQYLKLLFFLCCFVTASAQNIFDAEHSKEFANFLTQSRQFEFAAREYERILIYENTEEMRLNLLKSYRQGLKLDLAEKRLTELYPVLLSSPQPIFEEGLKIKFKASDFEGLTETITNYEPIEAASLNMHLNMLQFLSLEQKGKYKLKASHELINVHDRTDIKLFNNTYESYLNEKWKSPLLAASMSAVIPGAGRVYAGDWKNAIVSILFVGMNTFQSYRGFSRNGINSASGWIFGAIGLGFYVGNIYGSAWTASRKNTQKYERYKKTLEGIYFSD